MRFLKGPCADSPALGCSAEAALENRPHLSAEDSLANFKAIGPRSRGLLEYSPGMEASGRHHHALPLLC